MSRSSNTKDAKERILEAAKTEFVQGGFNGARLARIAKKAKVSPQLPYHYFHSKRGLYEAVLERALPNKIPYPLHFGGTSEELINDLLAYDDPAMLRLMLWEGLENKDGHFVAEASRRSVINSAVEVIRRAQEDGYLSKAFDPFFVYMTLSGILTACDVYPQPPRAMGFNPKDQTFIEKWKRHLWLVVQALRGFNPDACGASETLSGGPQETPARTESNRTDRSFSLEEARTMFEELIACARVNVPEEHGKHGREKGTSVKAKAPSIK